MGHVLDLIPSIELNCLQIELMHATPWHVRKWQQNFKILLPIGCGDKMNIICNYYVE